MLGTVIFDTVGFDSSQGPSAGGKCEPSVQGHRLICSKRSIKIAHHSSEVPFSYD